MTQEQILNTWEVIRVLWLKAIFYPYTLIAFLLMFLFNIIFFRKVNKFLFTTTIILMAGVFLFSVLFFSLFANHDCYMINLYMLLVINLLTFTELFCRVYPKIAGSVFVIAFLLFFLSINVDHTRQHMKVRYYGWWNEYPKYREFYTITPYLRSIGIQPLDTVICLPDGTHHTLYLMNLHGWTECFGQNKDSAGIAQSVQHGAKYLMVASHEDLDARPYVRPFITDTIGRYDRVLIFSLVKKK